MDVNDRVLRHFCSRAQQPRCYGACFPAKSHWDLRQRQIESTTIRDSVDGTDYRYVGVSPGLTQYEYMTGKKLTYKFMNDSA